MRRSLIAAGGAFIAATVMFGGVAAAGGNPNDEWNDQWTHAWGHWAHESPQDCALGMNDDATYHHVTKHGVFAGTRDADACKGGPETTMDRPEEDAPGA
ncbi:hypothetical protein MF672_020425 [Actinomadura sp. ATCC 31491]|uniref:Secreted protein n=1 Tax=Actinomadura luzonensis TaxID=2805427 RepID=A0ABT0FUY6_9ACTN|nr:hypothetical protein [Actinomadura luzonensis]MCK2216146.1 hypothetical protein [Actinomadura luzonensis]